MFWSEIFHNEASSMLTVVDVLILAKVIVTFVLSMTPRGGGGVVLRILGGVVSPGSSNPDPISDQKM